MSADPMPSWYPILSGLADDPAEAQEVRDACQAARDYVDELRYQRAELRNEIARLRSDGAGGDIASPEVIEALARYLHTVSDMQMYAWDDVWPEVMRDRARDVLAVIHQARSPRARLAEQQDGGGDRG